MMPKEKMMDFVQHKRRLHVVQPTGFALDLALMSDEDLVMLTNEISAELDTRRYLRETEVVTG